MSTDDSLGSIPPPPSPPAVDKIYPATPSREPVVALLLNIFFFCAGYFFIGQWQKGAAALAGFVLELILAFIAGLATLGCGGCVVIPISLAIHATLSIDAYLQAQQLRIGHPIGHWTFFGTHL